MMSVDNSTPRTDSYSDAERRIVGPLRQVGSVILSPLIKALARTGVTPNTVSVSQVALGVAVLLTVREQPRVAFSLFMLALLADATDGALARYTGKTSRFGALVDQYSDHAREILVIAAMVYAGGLTPLLAIFYALLYPATNLTLLLCNSVAAPLPLALKTYLFTYPAIFCYLWLGWNWLDVGVGLSLVLMLVTVLAGLWRLRGTLGIPS